MAQLDGDHWGMLSYKYNVDNNRTTEEAGRFEPKQRPTACSLMAVKLVAKQKQSETDATGCTSCNMFRAEFA